MLKNIDKRTKYLIVLWTLYAAIFLFVIIVFVRISNGKMGFMPTFEELENPQTDLATELYMDNGELLDKFFIENRTLVDYDELSPYLVEALVSTEDARYYRHSGIDPRGLVRVAVKTIFLGQNTGGGSTISQQLAKNLFPRDTIRPSTGIGRKIHLGKAKLKEWVVAARLERSYTKQEIMTMYLNTVPFGGEAIKGIETASRTFFDTSPDSLKIEEAAALVGMLQATTRFNPYKNPENSRIRRNIVFQQMVIFGNLDQDVADSLKLLPVIAYNNISGHASGNANHFRTFLRKSMSAEKPVRDEYKNMENFERDSLRWATDPLYGWILKNPKPDGTNYKLYTDGLKIYTTINGKMQEYAEQSMIEHLKGFLQPAFFREKAGRTNAPFEGLTKEEVESIMDRAIRQTEMYDNLRYRGMPEDSIMMEFHKKRETRIFTWNGVRDTIISPYDSIRYLKHILRSGFMAMEPSTGHVKAYVGDHNYRYFQYDHVTQGRRQVGSTVKPFLYLMVMQEGVSPCKQIPLVEVTFPDGDSTYTPEAAGSNPNAGKYVTLKWGLANSHNWVSAWIFKHYYNADGMKTLMQNMGITSHIDPVPSMIFGTSDISLEEMVGSYTTFANKGIHVSPVYVTRIEDKYGNVISTFQAREEEAISEEDAYLMVKLLMNVVEKGTAGRLRWYYGFEGVENMAAKTGTTQNQSDGWFMGITPQLCAGVWVGAEDRSAHFDNLNYGAGGVMAMPIWAKFFEKVYADSTLGITTEAIFEKPEGFYVDMDCVDVTEKPSGFGF